MNKEQVEKFIGKARVSKIDQLDVYIVTYYCNKPVYCIDALSLEQWTDNDSSHTFIYEGYDVTKREMMLAFRNWIDELELAA